MRQYLKAGGIALIIFAPFCAYRPSNQVAEPCVEITTESEARRLQIAVERRLAKLEQETMQTKRSQHAQSIRVMDPLEMLAK